MNPDSKNMTIARTSGIIGWVDYAKCMAIFFVVWLHVHSLPEISFVINAFVMPLFFIISGYLFSYERNPRYKPFVWKRTRQLLFPYVWINIVAYLCWFAVLRHFGDDKDVYQWHQPLLGALGGIPAWLSHDTPLWSLMSFYIVEIIYYPFRRAAGCAWVIAAGLATTTAIALLIPEAGGLLPLAAGPSMAGLVFFAIGNYCREHSLGSHEKMRLLRNPLTMLVLALIFGFSTFANTTVEFFICRYGNIVLFLISSLSGSLFIIGLASACSGIFKERRIIRFVSVGTLLICGFHLLVFAALKGIAMFCFGIPPEELTGGLIKGLVFASAAFLLCLPIVYIIQRYFPFLTDKK